MIEQPCKKHQSGCHTNRSTADVLYTSQDSIVDKPFGVPYTDIHHFLVPC